jgi:FkbM family methyltransferase
VICVEPDIDHIEFIRDKYRGIGELTIVPCALGAQIGMATLYSNLNNKCSPTMHPARMLRQFGWSDVGIFDTRRQVNITTLDALITQFGLPTFCKIDTEGHDAEVLAGLSRPIKTIRFEFGGTYLDIMRECIQSLASLGNYEFNFEPGERGYLALDSWQPPGEFITTTGGHTAQAMRSQPGYPFGDTVEWGQIYARII